ncbi:MAG: helix-turn-helix domain-containing protein [Eubacteriales bacterium]|nr:helix-turn-helix domain-containing protein [Eubacteriales bacterium]
MLSNNIKSLRMQNGLTQKELADKLHITSQAISRWEKGEVEPSVSTIGQMAEIFGVTTDEIIGGPDKKPAEKIVTKVEKEYIVTKDKPVLAVCDICKKNLFLTNDIIKKDMRDDDGEMREHIICKECEEKFKQEEFNQKVDYGNSQRVKSFIFSPLISLLILGIGIPTILKNGYGTNGVIVIVLIAVLSFTFASCVFFNNNCVKYTFFAIASWGVVKFPGLIFSFDLGGITWLIGMKILFWLLGLILGIAAAILGFVICLPLSLFVYPFALHKSITKPEEYEVI